MRATCSQSTAWRNRPAIYPMLHVINMQYCWQHTNYTATNHFPSALCAQRTVGLLRHVILSTYDHLPVRYHIHSVALARDVTQPATHRLTLSYQTTTTSRTSFCCSFRPLCLSRHDIRCAFANHNRATQSTCELMNNFLAIGWTSGKGDGYKNWLPMSGAVCCYYAAMLQPCSSAIAM